MQVAVLGMVAYNLYSYFILKH